MDDKNQWQEKDQQMKKKKEQKQELINANMKNNKAQITGTTLNLQNKSEMNKNVKTKADEDGITEMDARQKLKDMYKMFQ